MTVPTGHDILQAVLLVLLVGPLVALCFRRVRRNKRVRRTAIGVFAGAIVLIALVVAINVPTAGSSSHRCMTRQSCTAQN